jgi:hypothetical protein
MRVILRSTLALIAAFMLVPGADAQPLDFQKADVRSASGARAIITADFNRDGWPDLAEAGLGSNSVSVLLNAGGEHLALSSTVPVGSGPFDMATADFNRDGIPDLAVANADSNSISILLGRGDGRFVRGDIPTAPYRGPRGITAADVNADGKMDLIYSGYDSNLLQVLIGSGAGGFVKGWTLIGQAAQPQGLGTADFNRDGHLDLAVGYDSGGGLVIWQGRDGTTFVPAAVAGDADLNVIAIADLDGNGWADVAAASTSGRRVAVYLGTPSGLSFRRSYSVDSDPRGLAIADVNSDGVPDLIAAGRSTSTVEVLLGDAAHRGSFLPRLTFAAGRGSRAVVAADFDGNGRTDLATANQYAGETSILSNATAFVRAAYTFGERKLAVAPQAANLGVDATDFNRDGKLDVVTSGGWMFTPNALLVLLTDGPTVVLPGPQPLVGFVVGDFNNDGNPDLLYMANGESPPQRPSAAFLTYLGNGGGGFTPRPPMSMPATLSTCATGDMNSDARLDLVCIGFDLERNTQTLRLLRGHGDGTFHADPPVVLLAAAEGLTPHDLQVADVNRDGRLDIVVLNVGFSGLSDSLEVWLGNGAGGLTTGGRVASTMEESFRGFPACLRVADLNRDGHQDLVVYRGEGQLGVALGSASGFGSVSEVWRDFEVRYPTRTSIGIADIDVDGHTDVITPLGWILHGRGDGTFPLAERFAFLGQSVTVADFTRDGLPDILHTQPIDDSDSPPPPVLNGIRVLVNRRNAVNRPPIVSALDRVVDYQDSHPLEGSQCPGVQADASDPDQHAVTIEWRDSTSRVISISNRAYLCDAPPGTYRLTVTVRDGRGGEVTQPVVLTILPGREIVLYAAGDRGSWMTGNWSPVADPTAAGGFRAYDRNTGAAKVRVPSVGPESTLTITFAPDPTLTYKLWMRVRAEKDNWANDSVWVQFSGSVDPTGTPAYRTGSSSGLAVSLEECVSCGVSGWGWADDGWGAVNTNGVRLRFPEGGLQLIQIQTREDGVSVDQVVLSAEKYLTTPPGAAKNDATFLKRTFPVRDP